MNNNLKKNNDSQETRIALLEQSINHIGQTLIRIEHSIDKRLNDVNNKFDEIGKKIDKLDNRLWYMAFIVITPIVGVIAVKLFTLALWSK